MDTLDHLSLDVDYLDPTDTHLLLDKMESEQQNDTIRYTVPVANKILTSTPIKDEKDNKDDTGTPRAFSSVDLSEEESGSVSNNASGRSSPLVSGLPSITITAEPDPIEPEDIRVPILGHEVMESRTKFTSGIKSTKLLFPPSRSQGKIDTIKPGSDTHITNTVSAPIVGYEIMEKRERSIVYKIEVFRYGFDNWFVFRRYNDFYTLHDQLKKLFPIFRLAIPPRRWFRSNYDKEFLDERTLGLQAFLNNITGHTDICNSKCVRDFFCFDDPPGPHDSLEESRALCENLEETIYNLRKEVAEKDEEVDILHDELSLYKNQVELLARELKEVRKEDIRTDIATSPVSNQLSLAECDQETKSDSDHSANSGYSDSNINTDSEEKKRHRNKIPFKKKTSKPVVRADTCTYSS